MRIERIDIFNCGCFAGTPNVVGPKERRVGLRGYGIVPTWLESPNAVKKESRCH
jgi:hypothetical protein